MKSKTVVIVVLSCALIAVCVAFAVAVSVMRNNIATVTAENRSLAAVNQAYTQAITSKSGHFSVSKDWLHRQHADAAVKRGPEACMACHKETQCSYCHVKLLQ